MDRHGSLSASYIQQGYRGADDVSFLSLNYSNSLGRSSFFTAYATYADAGDSDMTVGISFTRNLGNRRSASTGVSHNDQGTRATAQIRSNLPVGPGFGYDLTAGIDDNDTEWQGRVDAASGIGRYSLGADRDQNGTSWGVNASGSAAWIGGRPFLAREIRDSFAVVRVNGFENTRVYLENQEIGKTDETGRILVPGLRPFQENRVRIALQDLPLTARIDEKEIVVAPYAGAGVTVDFKVRDGNDVMLRMLIPNGSPAPQGAVVVMDGQDRRFPVGIDGAVYLQDVATGTSGVLVWQDTRCGFTIHLPEDGRPVPDLGDVMCAYAGSE
jgi:outer membrane usher protein